MDKKYEFTDETMTYDGHLLHRIKRLSDGKIGGWIEKEDNLSQEGNCWVDDHAKVYDDAKVYGNAQVNDEAKVHDNAQVYDQAKVTGYAKVFGNAQVYDEAVIEIGASVCGNAKVFGNALIFDVAKVCDDAQVYDHARIIDNAEVYGDAQVYGNATIYELAKVYDHAKVYGDAKVSGKSEVYGNAIVFGKAKVYNIKIDSGEYHDYEDDLLKEVVQDFIYKVNDSNKITTQIEYNSINEFFDTSITNDIKLDTLVICTVDTKEPLIKLQKVNTESKTEFKFIVDITNENGDDFIFRSIIKSQEQLNQLILQTIEALKNYPQFSKYIDDLENCL